MGIYNDKQLLHHLDVQLKNVYIVSILSVYGLVPLGVGNSVDNLSDIETTIEM